MTLLERLRREAREFDWHVKHSHLKGYNQRAANLRDLLQEAEAKIREREKCLT